MVLRTLYGKELRGKDMGGFTSQMFQQGSNQGRDAAISAGKERRAEEKAKKRQKKVDAMSATATENNAESSEKRKKRIVGSNPNISSRQGKLETPTIGRRRLSV